jgi:hypothetical protein
MLLKKIVLLGLTLLCGGGRWGRVEPRKDGVLKASHPQPLGEVRIIDHAQKLLGGSRVDIWSYGTIYGALGVSGERFSDWESRYGMDSLGVGTDGSLFIPGFPVLSKVAWMYIDPIDLSDSETRDLVSECERAMANTNDVSSREVLRQIRDLALKAIQESATLRFGHP